MNIRSFLKSLGPGLLFAGAAIGVSHLVQSTRAGATFGFGLLWAVLLANFMKYPFYEYGSRYTLATGESLLKGFKRLGKWVLQLFMAFSLLTAFTIQAAVTAVTAGIAEYLLSISGLLQKLFIALNWDTVWLTNNPQIGFVSWSVILLLLSGFLLIVGHYKALDRFIKFIIIVLSITTFVALASAFGIDNTTPKGLAMTSNFDWSNAVHITLLIGLMGWMPSNLDMSVWQSLWTLEKLKIDPEYNYKAGIRDFNVGYVGVIILAVAFLALGALVMHGSGQTFEKSSAKFAGQLIALYTTSLGGWAKWIISIAALSAMFSTTLTCFDAISRMYAKMTLLMQDDEQNEVKENNLFKVYMLILFVVSVVIIAFFSGQMIALVTLATILSFLTAPVFAAINYKLVTSSHMPEEYRPNTFFKVISAVGFFLLTAFSLYYLWTLYVSMAGTA